jgi:hypothetical protein
MPFGGLFTAKRGRKSDGNAGRSGEDGRKSLAWRRRKPGAAESDDFRLLG